MPLWWGDGATHEPSPALKQLFDELNIPYFDYTYIPGIGQDVRYFPDELHSGEPIAATVLLDLMKDTRVRALLPNLDITKLDADLHRESTA